MALETILAVGGSSVGIVGIVYAIFATVRTNRKLRAEMKLRFQRELTIDDLSKTQRVHKRAMLDLKEQLKREKLVSAQAHAAHDRLLEQVFNDPSSLVAGINNQLSKMRNMSAAAASDDPNEVLREALLRDIK